MEWTRDGYRISTDTDELQLDVIHRFLADAYWSAGISRAQLQRSIDHSVCYGLYRGAAQVGFARLITDEATFAYLSDVFVLQSHRRRGLGKWLVGVVMKRPSLARMRRIMLATADAHGLYAEFGFKPLASPGMLMEISRPVG